MYCLRRRSQVVFQRDSRRWPRCAHRRRSPRIYHSFFSISSGAAVLYLYYSFYASTVFTPAQMLSTMTPAQRAQMAAQMGMPPDQMNQVGGDFVCASFDQISFLFVPVVGCITQLCYNFLNQFRRSFSIVTLNLWLV